MNKKNILIVLLSIITQLGFAQTKGSLEGKIINSAGVAVSDANVKVVGTDFGSQSDKNGDFRFDAISFGNYILRVSYVGYQTQEIAVSVDNVQGNSISDIVLSSSEEQLGEVVLQGSGNINDFTRAKSDFVAKMPLKEIENPQVYNTITSELLQEQVITTFDDALKNAPGITKLWEATGRGSDGAGYYSLRGFAVQPTMINGLPGVTNGSPDPANIESIEVLKGPSGTLYGSSLISYGGLINIVTKKPYSYFGGNVSYVMGSNGLNRVTADINTPLDEEGDVALRVNTAYDTRNSFQDAGYSKSFFVAPSLSYKVNDRLSFLINTEFYHGESTNTTMLFLDRGAPLQVNTIDQLGYDPERSFTSNDLVLENPNFSLQGQMNYKISDEWTSQTVVSRGSTKSKGIYSYLYEGTQFFQGRDEVPGEVTNLDEGIALNRYISDQNSTTLTTDIQQNFIGDFEIDGLRNRVVAGLDYYSREVIDNSSGYFGNGIIYIGNASLQNVNESVYGIYNADNYITTNDSGVLSKAGSFDILANAQRNNNKVKQEVYSAYVSDVLNILPNLSAMTSLRIDQFESDSNSQTAFSPKFGLVYQPILDRVALFANYMDGFSNLAPQNIGDLESGVPLQTVTFDPEHAKQFEVGTKLNIVQNKLAATFSYYDIQVSNTVVQIDPFTYSQSGERYSRGFEASLTASPVEGLNVIAGYSYNSSELTESDDIDFLNRRPESAGPESLANLWISYRLPETVLEGVGIGFGGNYASENMIFNRQLAGVFTLPEYTVLNASVFYDVDKFSINLKLNNLADKQYYTGWSTITPQIRRNFAAAVTYKF
ncbi:TonB-dependent receptor [Flavimarina sp. Hel_I_48]|uniref:TonB-dependent receptor n=1 Tax=Flavimarina sp. Hel_I_48 TaxID=1392488 RepID=UPI0004DFB6C9|nr:TonB-dependent receptor [Flavimarina sp. Hel_I_48]